MCAALQIVSRICAASISRRMPSLLLSLNEAVAAFRCYPPTPFSPNQEGVPNPLGVPGCLPSCFPLRGPNWCRYFSWGRRGSVHSACRPHPRCTGLGGGGVPIQPAGAPGCPHGAAEAGEGIRAEQPPPSSPHCIAIISIAPYGGSRCGVSSHPHPHPFLAGKQQWMQSSPSPS